MSTDGYGFEKNVEDMLVAELKEILIQNHLPTVGKKQELVSRLKDHLNDQPLKRKADESDDNVDGESANKKQKTESDHEEIKESEEVENNNEEEIEEVEYQEVGIQGEYQENQEEYHQGNEDNEEVVVEEVGAGRELYPEEKEEQEEKERNEESQSQERNDSKEPAIGLNKIPTLSVNNNRNNQGFIRPSLPPLRDQIKVALEEKNIEELDKLTKILLSQNDQMKQKLNRTQSMNDDIVRNFQLQGAAFAREKYMLQSIIRERDEVIRGRVAGGPIPLRPGPNGPPMARPPMKSAMPIPQPQQPGRIIPPTGQRYGQMPPVPRPPTSAGYAQPPLAQQQSAYSNTRPGYTNSSYQQQPSQYQSHSSHQQTYSQGQSYQQRKY
jgi:hypothetical protein